MNHRLEETIKYAKISGLEFQTAAELVTAATNSMDLSADRVVDVFAYLGDASASGADEIGTAMQKASAAAQEFGLSFEWLGSYIAVISEKTRLAPEVIGTSINAMLARLHAIRSTGYNSEDETKINDIAKALDTVNVKLFDQEGRWRSTTDIFEDVARQWNTIDGQTKAYIATTMAGTRQQNYFLTLMNDLSKGVEGGSRAWELYAGAMNAAGTATEKYSVWQESVTAAQNRMKAALEEMYSLLDSKAMVGFYNTGAEFIDFFTKATEASNGLNVTIPVLGGALVGLVAIFLKVKAAIAGTTGAFAALKAVITAHPIGALFAAVAVGIGLFTGLAAAFGSSAERYEAATERINEASAAIEGLEEKQRRLSESFEQLATNQNKTSVEEAEYTKLLKDMASISPVAKRAVDDFTAGMIDQAEAAEILNDELERNLRLEEEKKKQAAEQKYMNWEPSEESEKRANIISMKDLEANLGFNADGSFQISPAQYLANANPAEMLFSPLFKEIHKAMSSGYSGAALDSYL